MNPTSHTLRNRLRLLGIAVAVLVLWNGVADLIYGYSPELSGAGYFSPAVWDIIRTAGGRPHGLVMLAQTAGWLYPLYALSYFHWWVGMRRAGIWLSLIPCGLLAYAVLMIGGTQHTGWAFLSVLEQAKALVGSSDPAFFETANRLLVEHFVMGDLTAVVALSIGSLWHFAAILSGRTMYPRWFVVLSPFGVLVITMLVGFLLPAPFAGLVLAPFGTWVVLFPTLASTLWLWNRTLEQ
ncbi:MAG: hypothetical protein KC496_16855 [Anaerolineae bacterium]|nr:hypothetical protein [Anaerolineae bacterium]